MTFLETVNAVLRRLREDEVTSVSDSDYSKLIGDFVNQSINACEHAWDWNALKEDGFITTVSGTRQYPLKTFAGAEIPEYKIISALNLNHDWRLRRMSAREQTDKEYLSSLSGSPTQYAIMGAPSQDGVSVFQEPKPDAVESIYFLIIKYTQAYDIDGTDDSEVLQIPSLPVILNAYASAVSERGEDGGIGINEADANARTALADAIGIDASSNTLEEVSWHAC